MDRKIPVNQTSNYDCQFIPEKIVMIHASIKPEFNFLYKVYSGPEHFQHLKRPKCYFASTSVGSQVMEVLKRGKDIGIGHITLTMNTDGVPLYNSSSVSLWPVFLEINELPPSERSLIQNMIIWGLWQGCLKQ